ncbi:MAG: amino acid adenylation domain-containing protein, partial [Acidobacteria bacterium]|nr:amino acid adenylation domain-containing protein [Acidobacteriota bacterium]
MSLRALRWLTTDELAAGEAVGERLTPAPDPDALAYLQYTSGSTATPKGIMVSHGNLLHNSAYLDAGWRHTGESRVVSWLPHFHDMGLVYGIVQPLYKGFPAYLMPPAAFLQRPMLWLRAVSRFRATHSTAPNFAYDLCVRKADAAECEGLDLSCWEVAVNGAEPIRRATLEQFTETFAPYGFRAEAFCPGYGLAEATLKVSASRKGDAPVYCTTQAAALEQHRVVPAEDGEAQTQTLVGCGRLAPELKIAVVDPEMMRPCAPGEVGEIWVAGPSVALGYWNRPEETEQTFGAYMGGGAEGPYLRTGDLGFVVEGELYLTGRLKDLIIIRGRNHYPQDVELTAEQSHPDLRPGCGAAFSVEVAGEERLVIVQEVRRQYRAERLEEVVGAIRRDVAEAHELQVYAVVLVKPGGIHKTSSGKIQRHACRAGFLAGRLSVVGRSVLEETDESQAAGEPPARADLLAAEGEERRRLLASALREKAARLLKVSPAHLSSRRPLNTYGLDSLAALEMAHWVETRMGLSLQTTSLLAGAGLEELTDELVNQLDSPEPVRAAAFEFPRHTIGEHPLSYNQQALWLVHLLDREGPAYNISYTARVGAGVDASALRRVCQALVYRHASLRTTYAARDGQPVQLIREHQIIDFETVDASELGDEELSRRLAAAADRPFDLEGGGVLRVRLFERAGGEHVLLLTVHHIACDFWSLDLLASELRALLQAEAEGAKTATAPPELNYTDFTYWQADMLAGPEGERLWSYWREQLAGELPVLDLPTDRPRPPAQCYQGAAYTFELGEELGRELAAFAAREGATLYTTLLACFYVLLYRHGGQEDILVGSPTSGRCRPEFKDIVGHLVNPVVLRARPEGAATFRSFLREVRATVAGALAHQNFPFTLLAERLQPTRDPSLSPLFQVAFAWEKPQLLRAQGEARQAANRGAADGQAAELHDFLWRQGGAPYDLMLVALDEGDALRLTLQYRTELFDEARVVRMAGHFRTLVAGVVEDPARKLSELSLLGEEEQRQLVIGWNQTRAGYERDTCLHELFARRAADAADAIAARDEAGQITYAELDRRSNQLARRLRRLGVGPESVVGLYLPRGVRLVEAVLAVLKAGGAYLPLDTTSPAERLRLMVEGAAAPLVLTEAGGREKLEGVGATVVDLDAEGVRLARESAEPFAPCVTSENLAYVIYTSGSTGRPKGVAVSHRAVVNLLTDFERRQPLTAGEACSMWTSTGFDVSVYELFSPLAAGGTLHFVPERLRTRATDFLDWLEGERIQSAYVPPFMLAELAERLKASVAPRLALKRLLVGVEPIPGQTLAEIGARLPGLSIINGYGPTEATVCATLYDVDAAGGCVGNTPIGRPVRNTQVYLLDRDRNPVQVGTAGELHLAGEGLARGYLGLPELTAERFVPCPFAEGAGARMYRTGDLARHLADGNVEFLGRVDEQLKLHGVRIEPGEIETVLNQSSAVRDSVVMVRPDARGDKRLVAYVVPSPEQSVTPSQLRRHLQGKLPGFMTPSAFVLLESLPQTRNGKIDRNALPAPRERDYGQADGFVAPRTPVEELLAGIWQEVLGVERVGVEDDFFDLGGHSLLATQLTSRIRQAIEVEIPLPDFFETPNVAGLAEKIEAAVRTGASPKLPPVERVPREGPAPLSFAQRRLLFLEQLETGTPLYNIPLALRLSGHVNLHALEESVGELCKRHEALRTAFTDEPEPAQVVHAAEPFSLGLVDLSGLTAEHQTEAARRLMREESERPFDLGRVPLLRVRVLRVSGRRHLLLLSLHHLVCDGWSLRLLLSELGEL